MKRNEWRQDSVKPVDRSDDFYSYYRNIIPPDEWDSFIDYSKRPLPIVFRLVWGTVHYPELKATIQKFIQSVPDFVTKVEWLTPIEAFQLNVDRTTLRKSPQLTEFHRFLINQSEAGTLFRQEAVSMIPTLFIDVKPDSFLLDTSAAPGNKTSQLLEKLHMSAEAQGLPVPTGAVVANDICSTRGHMLIHQLRHLDSPALVVTNHAAQFMPNVFIKGGTGPPLPTQVSWKEAQPLPFILEAEQEGRRPKGNYFLNTCHKLPEVEGHYKLQYDAILCDVPCSGDGTIRKTKFALQAWDMNKAINLHRLQCQILRRALTLLKVGGTLVYSTCSMNPVENEAVVSSALATFGDSIHLVDQSSMAQRLNAKPGLDKWRIFFRDTWLESYDDLEKLPPGRRSATNLMVKSLFPEFCPCSRQRDSLKLCMRFYPHVNNTGGFFVAVFTKTAEHIPSSLQLGRKVFQRLTKSVDPEEVDPEEVDPEEVDPEEVDPEEVDPEANREASREANREANCEANHDVDDDRRIEPKLNKPMEITYNQDFISMDSPLARINTSALWGSLGKPFGFDEILCSPSQYLLKFKPHKQPQRIWFCTEGVARIINGLYRTPWKTQFAGCIMWEGRSSYHFRMRSCGFRWLPYKLSSLPENRILVLDKLCDDFLQVLTSKDGVQYDKLPGSLRARVEKLENKAPSMILCKHRGADIAFPVWKGECKIQVLIDSETKSIFEAAFKKE